jgi:glycosyltransferase involved in cell wall biosynthesis
MVAQISDQRTSIAFLYLGRRGALGQFTRELALATARVPEHTFDFIVSSDNEAADKLKEVVKNVLAVPTFAQPSPFNVFKNFFAARRLILEWLVRRRPLAVVTLLPHIWTPVLAPEIKKLGIKYSTVIHDAKPHPGDATAWLTRWLRQDARYGDLVITLSRAVAERLVDQRLTEHKKILPLFHPDLLFQSRQGPRVFDPDRPLRLIFFGRIIAYKGLSHLIDAVEMLREQGLRVELGVAGSGTLGSNDRMRLERLDAEIINRWIDEHEVTSILDRYDAVACPHIEASQSGAAAAAFGNLMPVVAMPIGGIAEQVVEGKTGVLAKRFTARAFAEATRRLAVEPGLYNGISEHLSRHAEERSMDRFLRAILSEVVPLVEAEGIIRARREMDAKSFAADAETRERSQAAQGEV